jgi:cyclopropane-fatty-acyl-phospholipid synthase
MAERAYLPSEKTAAKAMALVRELLRDYHPRDFAVELWDGARWDAEPGNFCRFTWHVNNPAALRAMFRSERQAALGEAYVCEEFDVSGDILAIFPLAEYLAEKRFTAAEKLRLASLFLSLPGKSHEFDLSAKIDGRLHSKIRDRRAVTFHYDLSNDFYQLWLDPQMVYSCAYFSSAEDSIEYAQREKLDYLCRKLRLRPGERLLDIGCGWGGLIMHAAREYGVNAIGITLSQEQLVLAQKRISAAELKSVCQARLLDYRETAQLGQFDKVVSVGMIEHVGESQLPEYFHQAYESLGTGGVFLNHGIARAGNREKPAQSTFTDTYVFPDADLVPISIILRCAEESGFEIRDIENLREHYFLTLCQWLRRLETNAGEARRMIGETKYRIWRLYLAGSAYYFQSGKLGLYQTLLTKNGKGESPVPLRREDWYR